MTERELLADCLRRLNRLGIPYMLTGSMASNYWGVPRTTHDLDFVVALSPERASDVVAAFRDDFTIEESWVRSAFRRPYLFNAIDLRSALKVDFWVLRPEGFEGEMFRRRLAVTLFGEPAWVATAEDTILHKLHWNRIQPSERQLGDAAGIWAVQGPDLDRAYLERWARDLEVSRTLEDLESGRIRVKET